MLLSLRNQIIEMSLETLPIIKHQEAQGMRLLICQAIGLASHLPKSVGFCKQGDRG